jgi:hypothetical protein
MLCDHSGPHQPCTPCLRKLQPHATVKPRESALIPIVTTCLHEAGPTQGRARLYLAAL